MRGFLAVILLVLLTGCSAMPGGDGAVIDLDLAQPIPGAAFVPDGYSRVAENSNYSLWLDPEHAAFEIRSSSGIVWRSLPEFYDDTAYVHEMLKNNHLSLITVTALDASLANTVLNCYEESVRRGAVKYEKIQDGIRFVFDFERQEFTVPLDIILTDNGFLARIAPGGIRQNGDFTVSQIMVLPYFNSGTSDDNGFLFYPDGSGALAYYGAHYNNAADITQTVYGFDRGIGMIENVPQAYGYLMPVYGARTNDAAYLAVIEGPSSFAASVFTGVERSNNRYFRNGAIFNFRDTGRVFLRHNETSVNTSYVIPSPVTLADNMTLRYFLLEGEEGSPSGMAAAYRSYLEREGVLTERLSDTSDIHLTLLGMTVKNMPFLGIPTERGVTLTTFAQADTILTALKDQGIGSASARYIGAQDGGYKNMWTRDFKLESSLGGRNQWRRLMDNNPDDVLFLNGELLQVFKNKKGYTASNDAARTTGNGLNFQYNYFLQDGSRDSAGSNWTLLAPSLWQDTFERFGDSALALSPYISVEDAGVLIYSEYNREYPAFRDQTGVMMQDSLRGLADRAERFALTGGNAYVWGIADTLYSVPLGASGYFIQSAEFPFYQMVIHGYIEYSGDAMNFSADKRLSMLRSIEYGALPHYYGMYAPSGELNDSSLSHIFSACYKDWLGEASGYAAEYGDLYRRIAGVRMTDHRQLAEGIYQTTYENGVTVTVDYNSGTFITEGY